ncbi:4Fe-4S dicluster domain-containing protein [Chloroflexota bacterium]
MHIREAKTFVDEIAAEPGGEKINECIQCGVCSGSCTTVEWWEFPPRKIIAMARAGMRDEVLSSSSVFNCVTCHLCTVRCPRNIQPAQLMHAVAAIAERHGYQPKTPTLALFRALHKSMRRGRIWEFGMALNFYISSNILKALKDLPIAWSLISRGLMPIKPPKSTRGAQEVKAILNTVETMQSTGGTR